MNHILRGCFFCVLLLWLSVSEGRLVLAHEEAPGWAAILLPACRVVINRCVAVAPTSENGLIQPFPPGKPTNHSKWMLEGEAVSEELEPLSNIPCENGFADVYPCKEVDLLAFLPLSMFGSDAGNTLWGWTDPLTEHEYALLGLNNGAAFIDISDPTHPRYVGKLPTHSGVSHWRDIKVYQHYAYIGSDLNPGHGLQVFDLAQLRTITASEPLTLTEISHYDVFSNSHNIVINEESGFAYAVGTETCGGGLHIIDIRQPAQPVAAGCYDEDGYIHDAQCVIYRGPDSDYQGKEICFNAAVTELTVVDVTDKQTPRRLSSVDWPGIGYIHQGWLTADQHYLLVDDEFDERNEHHNGRTYVLDVADLDNLRLIGDYTSHLPAIDHNLYISDTYVYQANYTAGLRVLDLRNIALARLREVAYFDTYPAEDEATFTGAWSPYPFFASGIVLVSTIDRGLFILKPQTLDQPEHLLYLPVITAR
jgi:choice-of-anchor B domain-containing protein